VINSLRCTQMLIGVLIALPLMACEQADRIPEPQLALALQSTPAAPVEHAVTSAPQGTVPLVAPATRPRRRLDIDQLNTSIRDVTGGIEWTDPETGANLFTALQATLGKPDYALMTNENLNTTALFLKFLNDAARQTCHELMNRELSDNTNEKILFQHVTPEDTYATAPDKVRKNLSALLLRFHGKRLAPDAPGIELWRWLYESAEHVASNPSIAWRTVCAGLISHPDFYMY
jgi:hypothetical protein